MPPKPWSGVAETAFARNAVSEYVGTVSQLLAAKGAAMRGGGISVGPYPWALPTSSEGLALCVSE